MRKILRYRKSLEKNLSDFKCPECKAFALWVDDRISGKVIVRCKKCGFSQPLVDFAENHMDLHEKNGEMLILKPDLYSNERKTVRLEPDG